MDNSFDITPSACQRLREILERDKANGACEGLRLRISVMGGGCSGFQYAFTFDEDTTQDDHLFDIDGAYVVIDTISLDFLKGASLDFEESLIGSSFVIRNNPNAASSCGCGSSFSPL